MSQKAAGLLSIGLFIFGVAGVWVGIVNIENPFVAFVNGLGAGLLVVSAWISTAVKLSKGENADGK